jgi:hypothetical protein
LPLAAETAAENAACDMKLRLLYDDTDETIAAAAAAAEKPPPPEHASEVAGADF